MRLQIVIEGPKGRPEGGSQSKFLKEFGLCPNLQPKTRFQWITKITHTNLWYVDPRSD